MSTSTGRNFTSKTKIRNPKKRAMLAALANSANILKAAGIAGISRESHYDWLRDDPEYREAFEVAWERAADALEAEAARRAFEGTLKPVYNNGKRAIDVQTDAQGNIVRDAKGNAVGVPAAIREYSDTLLIFLLKGKRPAVYRDNVSIDQRFVNKDGSDRPFLLGDMDRVIAEADAADAAAAETK